MTTYSLPNAPKIRAANFRLQRMQAFNPLRGGHHQGVDVGEALWLADIETTELSRAQGGSYKWLLAKMRGVLRTLYVYDASRSRPLAYRTGGSWGSPRVTAVNYAAGTIDLDNLAANAVISEGDYGHWDDGTKRRLHICGAGVANGSGVLTGLAVEPRPPSTVTASLPVAFTMEKASAEMAVFDYDIPFQAPATHRMTLKAIQVLRRS